MNIKIVNTFPEEGASFDIFIYAVGYEERSSHVAKSFAKNSKIVLGFHFDDGKIHSFDKNKVFFEEIEGIEFTKKDTISEKIKENCAGVELKNSRIGLDVSSLNRGAMARIIGELLDSDDFAGSHISILYAVAKFHPPKSQDISFVDFQPIDGFGGWTRHPERPAALLLGLGYETDHAVGAVEALDPSATFCFFPFGFDERYEAAVRAANEPLLDIVKEDRIVSYPVKSPYQTYWQMNSLLRAAIGVSRPILVPMGPKIFCSLCLLCQRILGDEVSVWRASGHSVDGARDAQAEGPIVGYSVIRQGA
ncbi:hypothetical protein [Thalassospira sp.]|uniref:hypothetical protein n=1 Tax=Thalassospira sp. TaxID=1912094 RepID=UPI003AA80319